MAMPQGWGLHVWGDGASLHTDWSMPLPPARYSVRFLHAIPCRPQLVFPSLSESEDKNEWHWDIALRTEGNAGFLYRPDLTQMPAGSITKQAAIW